MAAEHLLHDLDESQRRAVTSPAQPLAIVAPAGSGKTRVLTRRIAWRVETEDADASHVLALTFTRKAAAELGDRVRRLGLRDGVATGTFHGVAWAQLRNRWADEGRTPPRLLARKAELLSELVHGGRGGRGGPTIAQLAGEIEWAKARLVGPDGYPSAAAEARRRPPVSPERIAELYRGYEDKKRAGRMVDFDDLLKLCSHYIETDPAFAKVQRWRFRHLFVDEFQDVNPLQLRLLDAWRGSTYDLCVVGDPHQAIYGWNGADSGLLIDFRRLYPPSEVIPLVGNYRSSPQVLDAAAGVLAAAELAGRTVHPTRPDGPPVRLERHDTDGTEAAAIARAVRDRRDPRRSWSAQAVLVRTHAQIPAITEALRRTNIPYRVRGGDALLERPEVRDAIDLLRRTGGTLAAAARDLAAMADEAQAETTGISDDDSVEDHRAGERASERAANLAMLEELAHDHLRLDPAASTGGFIAWLIATLRSEGESPATDAVTIATFHAAKGLEWPVVHLAGLEDGLVPITHARTKAALAEEARLLYVAMTRAEEELRCTWAAKRTFGDKAVDRTLTRWLRGLSDRQRDRVPDQPIRASDSPAHLAEARAALAQAAAAAQQPRSAELEALHIWRAEAARSAICEPATLVDDQLLDAIARHRPCTLDELRAIEGMGPVFAARHGDDIIDALAGVDRAGA